MAVSVYEYLSKEYTGQQTLASERGKIDSEFVPDCQDTFSAWLGENTLRGAWENERVLVEKTAFGTGRYCQISTHVTKRVHLINQPGFMIYQRQIVIRTTPDGLSCPEEINTTLVSQGYTRKE